MADSILDTQLQPEAPPPEPTKTETPATPENTDSTQTIVVSGPLSSVYTKALQVAFARSDDVSVVTESSAIDTTLLLQQKKQNEENQEASKKPLYVYVTDDEHLQEDGLPQAFDQLRIALSKESYGKVILCLHDGRKLTKRQVILDNYVSSESLGKVLHSQKSLINYLV